MVANLSESGLFFIRHGQTDANRDGILSGGDSDVHLTGPGRDQARKAGTVMQRLDPTPGLIITAPLSRTLETTEILNIQMGLDVTVEPGLVERQLGEWNGLSVEAKEPLLTSGVTPHGGEPNDLFRIRVLNVFRRLMPHYLRWPLLVSSRGVARILLEHAGRDRAITLSNGAILRVTVAPADDGDNFQVGKIDCIHQP